MKQKLHKPNAGCACPMRFSPETIQRTRKALKDDAAGNKSCTMTDLDLACEMLDEMVALTEKGCEEYMEQNGHNVRRRAFRGEVRIFVESLFRCQEMVDLRAALMNGVAEKKELTALTEAIRAFVTADADWTTALRDHAMGRPSDLSATGAARHAAKTALYKIASPPEDAAASAADAAYYVNPERIANPKLTPSGESELL